MSAPTEYTETCMKSMYCGSVAERLRRRVGFDPSRQNCEGWISDMGTDRPTFISKSG